MKAWKGLAAIKHKVVRPAGRLNPFPAFSRPDPFCPSNLFLVSSFVPQISLSGRGPSKEGVKICTMRAVTTALLLDEISRLWCVHVYIWCVHVYVQKLSGILFYWRSKQEEGRGKSVREQDRYQGIMAPHKIGNRPPFVKVSTNLKRHMFDTGLNIPYTLNISDVTSHILCWWNLRPGKEWSILCESTAGNGKLVPLRQMSEFVFCQVSICVFCQAGIGVFCLIDLSDIIRGSSRHANLSPHTPSPCDVFARPLIPCQDGNRVGRVIMIIVTLTICPCHVVAALSQRAILNVDPHGLDAPKLIFLLYLI